MPALLVLVAASGCAALIYQVVWFQLLGFVIGASAASLGVLLGTFMGGTCIGSLVFARSVPAHHRPLRVYAAIELGIAVLGVTVLFAMPAMYRIYVASGSSSLPLRAAVAGAALLAPTILMGATLPAIARALPDSPRRASALGWLYAANIAGAVVGSLLAGYWLLRLYDVTVATLAAVGLNAAAAAACLVLRVDAAAPTRATPAVRRAPAVPSAIYVAIALSGMTALAAEVLWTRQLSLLIGGTVYTFALIVAMFLLGLGLGSGAGAAIARRRPPRTALAWCQLMLCAAIAWAGYVLADFLPYWPLDVSLPTRPWVALQLDLLRVAIVVLPGAVLWGASFPLALAAAAPHSADSARLVGRVYAANTLGAIAGALGTAFVLIAWLGSARTQQLMMLTSAAAALLLIAPAWSLSPARRAAAAATTMAAAVALALVTPGVPRELVAYGRFLATRAAGSEILFAQEGVTASVAVSRQQNGAITYHNAGKAQASSYAQDMRLQRMLGHLTTLVPDRSEQFLVIGLGAGITAGAVSADPAARRVVVAEIEPLSATVAGEYFGAQNFDVVRNPKVELHIDDGRHYLATTRDTFDGITSDPLDPWVKGAAALYTLEFWQLVRSRLNDGGVVTVFLQLYESNERAVQSEVATFFAVFPNGVVLANTVDGAGYDAVLVGRAGDRPIDVVLVDSRLRSAEREPVARSLRQVGFASAYDLLGTFAGGARDLAGWLEGAELNTDRNLRLQYLAGDGLNAVRADSIMQDMLRAGAARSPDGVFAGSEVSLYRLEQAIRAQAPSPRDDFAGQ